MAKYTLQSGGAFLKKKDCSLNDKNIGHWKTYFSKYITKNKTHERDVNE